MQTHPINNQVFNAKPIKKTSTIKLGLENVKRQNPFENSWYINYLKNKGLYVTDFSMNDKMNKIEIIVEKLNNIYNHLFCRS